MSNNIITYTGIHMAPSDPHPDKLAIEDIAHALSLMTRANGHFKTFYSVAQHCIGCAIEAKARGYSRRVQLGCLLHDASEAYISDITRPVKHLLPKYIEVEKTLQEMIWNKWLLTPLTDDEYTKVFDIDDLMLYEEFYHFTGEKLLEPKSVLLSVQEFDFKSFAEVEEEYLTWFKELTE